MLNQLTIKQVLSNRGTAYVELMVALPLLVFLFYSTIEYTKYLRTYQLAQNIVQHIANMTFRDCTTSHGAYPDSCAQMNLRFAFTEIGEMIPRAKTSVSLWRWCDPAVPNSHCTGGAFPKCQRLGRAACEGDPDSEQYGLCLTEKSFEDLAPGRCNPQLAPNSFRTGMTPTVLGELCRSHASSTNGMESVILVVAEICYDMNPIFNFDYNGLQSAQGKSGYAISIY